MPRNIPFPETERGQEPDLFFVQDWGGVNTRSKRPAIAENQFAWVENYFPIAPGNLRSMWSNAAALYNAPPGTSIIYTYFFNLFTIAHVAVFLSDGTAYQVNIGTGQVTTISSNPGEFYAGGFLPAAAQWTAQGIVIVSESQNPQGYFAWDGVKLYRAGDASPVWLNDGEPTPMPSGIHGNGIEVYQSRVFVTTPPQAGIPTLKSISAPGNGASFNVGDGGLSVPQQDASLKATFTGLKQSNGFLYEFGDSSVSVLGNIQTTATGVTTFSEQSLDPQAGTTWPGTIQSYGRGILFANPFGVHAIDGGVVTKISAELDGLFEKADFGFIPTGAVCVMFGVKVYCLLLRAFDQTGQARHLMCIWDGVKWFFGSQDAALDLIASQELNSVLTAWGSNSTTLFQMFAKPSSTLPKTLQSKFWAGGDKNVIKFKKVMRFYFELQDIAATGVTFSGTIDSDFANAALNVDTLNAVNNAGQLIQPQNVNQQNIYAVNFGLFAASTGFFEFTNAAGGIIHFTNVMQTMDVLNAVNENDQLIQPQNLNGENIYAFNFGEPNPGGIILWGVSAVTINGRDVACYGRLIGVTLGTTAPDFVLICYAIEYGFDAPFLG